MIRMRIVESFKARFRDFKRTHFSLFKEGRALRKLKSIHEGKRCFIIGNGPSLSPDDLDILKAHNEITFAFNRIFHIFDLTSWRPTYYVSQDVLMLKDYVEEVNKIQAHIKFLPISFKWDNNLNISDVLFFNLKNSNNSRPFFSKDISDYIYNSNTVVYTAIQIAVYMGFKDIYLIGVDHHFNTSVNREGRIIIDNSVKDYFSEKYNIDKDKLDIPNIELSTLTFEAANFYLQNSPVKVYNATRGGRLNVFERINFDSLFL